MTNPARRLQSPGTRYARTSQPNVLSRPEQHTSAFHRGYLGPLSLESLPASAKRPTRRSGPRFTSCCHQVQTNQSTCLEMSLRRNKKLKLHCLCKSKGLLLNEEEKELAVQPALLQILHLLRDFCASDAESHCDDKSWQRQAVKPNASPNRDSPNTPVLSPAPPTGL